MVFQNYGFSWSFNGGKPLWGCMFMDKSKNILETNQDVWYLDLTHRVSRDFGKRMKTVLFTYTLWWHVIKLLEWEYLCAFHYKYIERRSNHSVLGFLKLHSVKPKQVMIDCSMPERSAIKTVFQSQACLSVNGTFYVMCVLKPGQYLTIKNHKIMLLLRSLLF